MWILLLECDYVWMKPMPTPGNADDLSIAGWQYHFGYIIAQHRGERTGGQARVGGGGREGRGGRGLGA